MPESDNHTTCSTVQGFWQNTSTLKYGENDILDVHINGVTPYKNNYLKPILFAYIIKRGKIINRFIFLFVYLFLGGLFWGYFW